MEKPGIARGTKDCEPVREMRAEPLRRRALATTGIGERRSLRHEPEQPEREGRQPAARLQPASPSGSREIRPPIRPRGRTRRRDPPSVVSTTLPRLYRGHVPVIEVPLQHEPALRARGKPERAARRVAAARNREEDRPGDLLVQPRHRVLQGHTQGSIVDGLDADLARAGDAVAARTADVLHLGTRVGGASLRRQRSEPGAAEVLRGNRDVVAPAEALAQVKGPDEPVLTRLPRLGEIRLDAAAREAGEACVELVRRRLAKAGRRP